MDLSRELKKQLEDAHRSLAEVRGCVCTPLVPALTRGEV